MTIKTFLFHQWRHTDQQQALIKSLWIVIIILVILNGLMWLGWKSAPDRIRVYLPPDLSSGALVTPGAIPKSTIYALGSSRVDLQACKLEYSIVSPK